MNNKKKIATNLFFTIFGGFLYAIGANFFIAPLKLYNGGIYGACQIFRTFLSNYFDFGNIDFAGVIYFFINIPLLIVAYKNVNKKFFLMTFVNIISSNIFLTFITISHPIVSDKLVGCICGGLICGFGCGIALRAGASSGGTDIIGMVIVKHKENASVGKFNLLYDAFLYLICGLLFNVDTAIYSVIVAAASAFVVDRIHSQNINVNALIFTDDYQVAKALNKMLHRGSTSWEGKGDYTGNKKYIISTVISKYEMNELKHIVSSFDENAFVIFDNKVSVYGNIEKHLDA